MFIMRRAVAASGSAPCVNGSDYHHGSSCALCLVLGCCPGAGSTGTRPLLPAASFILHPFAKSFIARACVVGVYIGHGGLNVVDFGFVCLGVFVFVGCWIWIAGLAVCLFVCLLTVESGNED